MRAAITAWAWRTPLGNTIDGVMARLHAGERAAQPNPHFPAGTYACKLAAAIPDPPERSPHARILRRMGLHGFAAGRDALLASGVSRGPRLGLFAAVGGLRAHWDEIMTALAGQRDDLVDSWERGFKRLHPLWMLRHLSNNTHALLAQDLDCRGEGATYGGASAGAQALAAAIRALADRAIDAALVVAHDSLIEPEALVDMAARGVVATCGLHELAAPYHAQSRGFVPGEAAAALVLEPCDAAEGRVLAMLQARETADGSKDLPEPATVAALARALHAGDTIVDGAAQALAAWDAGERRALADIMGADALLGAVQSGLGQLGAAASLVQAICLAEMLRRGWLLPVAGLVDPAPGPLVPVLAPARTRARSALGLCAGAPGLAGAIRVSLV